jgi:AraC family transcriptional regulator, regulatory protein of adaptative response / DNA-3-methyladenine glycosylase II
VVASVVRLRLPSDFDRTWALGFLAARAVPALERADDASYARSVRVDGQVVTLACRFDGATLTASSAPSLPPAVLRGHVSRLFDLRTDLAPFRAHARRDPTLRRVVAGRPAVRALQYLDPFEGILRAVLGQQVSLAAARTMADRLVRIAPGKAPTLDGFRPLAFPTARELAALGADVLRSIGLTRAKSATLAAVARAVRDGVLDWERLRRAPPDRAEADLTALPGIGPWTAAYTRMRCLGHPDAFPAGDLGVRQALARARPSRRPWTEARARAAAEAWRPWRSYATLALWASLA